MLLRIFHSLINTLSRWLANLEKHLLVLKKSVFIGVAVNKETERSLWRESCFKLLLLEDKKESSSSKISKNQSIGCKFESSVRQSLPRVKSNRLKMGGERSDGDKQG